MRSSLALLILAVGCVPPPPVGGGLDTGVDSEPALQIVFPPPDTLEIALNNNCDFQTVVAIDVDNFELINPAETEGDKDGQGHWHLQMTVPDRGYTVVFDQSGTMLEEDIPVGELVTIRAALQSNTHEELIEITNFQSVIEVTVAAPMDTGVVCP